MDIFCIWIIESDNIYQNMFLKNEISLIIITSHGFNMV